MEDATIARAEVVVGSRTVRCALDEGSAVATFEIVEGAAPTIAGTIKWDGCMDWLAGPNYYHFCSPDDAAELSWLFDAAWGLARSMFNNGEF